MSTATSEKTFTSLKLSDATLKGLEAKGYATPTDCQFETIPRALAGRDLVVQSRTGTGKTAAFGVPIVEGLDPDREGIQAVVLTPELPVLDLAGALDALRARALSPSLGFVVVGPSPARPRWRAMRAGSRSPGSTTWIPGCCPPAR